MSHRPGSAETCIVLLQRGPIVRLRSLIGFAVDALRQLLQRSSRHSCARKIGQRLAGDRFASHAGSTQGLQSVLLQRLRGAQSRLIPLHCALRVGLRRHERLLQTLQRLIVDRHRRFASTLRRSIRLSTQLAPNAKRVSNSTGRLVLQRLSRRQSAVKLIDTSTKQLLALPISLLVCPRGSVVERICGLTSTLTSSVCLLRKLRADVLRGSDVVCGSALIRISRRLSAVELPDAATEQLLPLSVSLLVRTESLIVERLSSAQTAV